MKLKALIAIGVVIYLFGIASYAQEKPITLWIMPNESLIAYKPTDREIERFLRNNPNIKNTDSELKSDHEFARCVLGQTKILELIQRYKKEKNFTGSVNLRILKWPDAFGEISDATIAQGASSPDIVQLGSTWNAYFASKGALVEITRYVDEKLYFESSIKSCKINGSKKIYALPLNVDIRVLYYWKNIIDNPEVELGDWEALKKICHRIQKLIKDRNAPEGMFWSIGFPIALGEWDMLHQLAIWVWSAGGEIVRSKKILGLFPLKQANLDSKEIGDVVTFLRELTNGTDIPQPQLTLGELEERFIRGEFGMIITGGWLMERLKDRFGEGWKDRVGVALPPTGPNGRFTFTGGCNLAIFKAAKGQGNFEQAINFLLFLSGREVQVQYGEATGALPGLKEAMDEYIVKDPSYQIFKQALKCGKSYPSIPEWAELVEKKVTLNNLYRFWKHNIIDRRGIREVRLDLENANLVLNDEFGSKSTQIFKQSQYILFPLIFLIGCIIALKIIKRQNLRPPDKSYEVTIYLKELPKGNNEDEWREEEDKFLENLLNPNNTLIEIKKKGYILKNRLNDEDYKNQKILFSFIAYISKYKEFYVSPSGVSGKIKRRVLSIEEEKLYPKLKAVLDYSDSSYKQWANDIRKEVFSKIFPYFKEGWRIDNSIAKIEFKKLELK